MLDPRNVVTVKTLFQTHGATYALMLAAAQGLGGSLNTVKPLSDECRRKVDACEAALREHLTTRLGVATWRRLINAQKDPELRQLDFTLTDGWRPVVDFLHFFEDHQGQFVLVPNQEVVEQQRRFLGGRDPRTFEK